MPTRLPCMTLPLAEGRVEIRFAPEPATGRLVTGRAPEEAVRLIGLAHNLCAEAHRATARAALGLAQPEGAGETIALETLRTHLFALARTAPAAIGLPAAPVEGMAEIFGTRPDRAALQRLARSLATTSPFALLVEAAASLDAGIPEGDEAGSLAQRLKARIRAMHRALAALIQGETTCFLPRLIAPGTAAIEAARGKLTHRASLAAGRISAYDIQTPTARMLAPGGELESFLAPFARATGPAEARIRLGIAALDPCLAHQVAFMPRAVPAEVLADA